MNHVKRKSHTSVGPFQLAVGLFLVAIIAVLASVIYKNHVEQKAGPNLAEVAEVMEAMPGLISSAPISLREKTQQEALDFMGEYAQVPGLVEALSVYEKDNPCVQLQGRFRQLVLGVTEDKTQALIGNACGAGGMVRSFMVKQDDNWVRVGSWDGKFSNDDSMDNFSVLLDTPNCAVVEEHAIQRSIAPVCFKKASGQSSLFTGDTANYTYVLRN